MASWDEFQQIGEVPAQDAWGEFTPIGEQVPQEEQPGYLGSLGSEVARGLAQIGPGVVGGLGYLTGSETLQNVAGDLETAIQEQFPVNPQFQDDFAMQAANVVGQVGGVLATGGLGGAAARALGGVGAVARGAQALPLVTGALGGAYEGGQQAEQYQMEGLPAYLRTLAGAGTELLTERIPFGMLTETAAARRLLGDLAPGAAGTFAGAVGSEAVEEGLAQVGGNVATQVLAPEGVETPGIFEGAGTAALLGGVGGAALGGVNVLANRFGPQPRRVQPEVEEIVETEAFPDLAELESLAGPAATNAVAAAVAEAITEPVSDVEATPTVEPLPTGEAIVAPSPIEAITPEIIPEVTEPQPLEQDATLQRQVAEDRIEERLQTDEGGTIAEAGRSNRLVEGGQVQEEVTDVTAAAPLTQAVEGVPTDATQGVTEAPLEPGIQPTPSGPSIAATGQAVEPITPEGVVPTETLPVGQAPTLRNVGAPSLTPSQQRNEGMARRRRGAATIPNAVRSRDGSILPSVRIENTDATQALSLESQIPGVQETWTGTSQDFLAQFGQDEAFGRAVQAVQDTPDLEAFYDPSTDRVFVLSDRVRAREGDEVRASKNGTTTQVEAVRRLLRHEAFVHRGWRALPKNLRDEFLAIADDLVSPAQLDALVKSGYARYKAWRDDPEIKILAVEEWLAQRLERMEKLPVVQREGPLAPLFEWLQKVWQWISGDADAEATPQELLDLAQNMVRALQTNRRDLDLPEPTGVVPSYIGESAQMSQFMRDSLETARIMAASGKSSEEIRTVTGWFPGRYDGKMRWELPDNQAAFVDADTFKNAAVATYGGQVFNRLPIQTITDRIKSGNFVRLSDVFNHPALFAAYPDAANIPFFPIGGNIVQGSHRVIDGNSVITATVLLDESGQISEESTSVLLHELQHYIQHLEGFAKGASPDSLLTKTDLQDAIKFRDAYQGLRRYRNRIAELVDAMAQERAKSGFLGFGGPNQKAIKSIEDKIKGIQESVNAVWRAQGKSLSLDRDSTRAALLSAINKVEDELGASWVIQNRNEGLNRIYKRVAGEIEARDVQARRTMTQQERLAQEPYSSENIAKDEALIIYGETGRELMMSIPANADELRDIATNAGRTGQLATSEQTQLLAEAAPSRPTEIIDAKEVAKNLEYEISQFKKVMPKQAQDFVDKMGPMETWSSQLLVPENYRALGLESNPAFAEYVWAEMILRTSNAARKGDPIAIRANREIVDGRSRAGTDWGKSGAAKQAAMQDPRYRPLFLLSGVEQMQRQKQKDVVDAQVNVTEAVEATKNADTKAQQEATNAVDEDLRLEQTLLEMGLATFDEELQQRIRNLNALVLRRGILLRKRAEMQGLRPSLAGVRVSDLEAAYAGLTLEQIEAELANVENQIRDEDSQIRNKLTRAPKKQRATDIVSQATNLIAQLEAPAKARTKRENPVRDIYREHLKNPTDEATFVQKMLDIGVPEAPATKLFELASLKIAAAELAKRQRTPRITTASQQAQRIIAKKTAPPTQRRQPQPNPVRDLFNEQIKNPIDADEFNARMNELGVSSEDAQRLFDLAEVEASKIDDSASEEVNAAERFAERTIQRIANTLADPTVPEAQKERTIEPMRDLYNRHLRSGLQRDAFIADAVALGVTQDLASRLWNAGNLLRESRQRIKDETAEQKKVEIADRDAARIIFQTSKLHRQSGFINQSKDSDSIRKAFSEQVKSPKDFADFESRMRSLNVSDDMIVRLFNVAERENVARRAVEAERERQRGFKKLQVQLENLLDPKKQSLRNLMQKALKDSDIPVRWVDLFSHSQANQRQWRQELFAKIRQHPALQNLSAQEARDLAEAFDREWNAKRNQAFQREMKRVNLPGTTKETRDKVSASVPKLLKYINSGLLDNDDFREAVAPKFGITQIDRPKLAKAQDLAEKAQDPNLTPPERTKLLAEMSLLLQDAANVSLAEVTSNYWVTSVLSGFRTQFDTAFSFMNGLRIMAQTMAYAAIRRGEFKLAGQAGRDYLKTLFNAIREGMAYFVTGDPTILDSYPQQLDTFMREGASAAMPFDYFEQVIRDPRNTQIGKIIPRFMVGIQRAMRAYDHFNSASTTEGMKSLAIALNNDLYSQAKLPSKKDIEAARKRAIEVLGREPRNPIDRARVTSYTRQILNQKISEEFPALLDEAQDIGRIASYQNDPTGLGGIIYHTLLGITNKATSAARQLREEGVAARRRQPNARVRNAADKIMRDLLYAMAVHSRNLTGTRFVRFAGNKINEMLSFVPGLGLTRLMEKDMTELKKSMIITNNTVGFLLSATIVLTLLRSLQDEEDDEKRGWRISGSWKSMTPDQKNQLRSQKMQPYTIEVFQDGKWVSFNYVNWPVSNLLAMAGTFNDLRKYNPEKWDEKTLGDNLVALAWAGMISFKDMSALSGVMEILGASAYASDPVEASVKSLVRLASNYVGGGIPKMIKDIDVIMHPDTSKAIEWHQQFAKELPFYRRDVGRPMYDIFGERVQTRREPWSRAVASYELPREYQILGDMNAKGVFLGAPNPDNRAVGRGENKRDLTEEEGERYVLEVGRLYKDFVLKAGDRILAMDNEQAKRYVSEAGSRLREIALRKATAQTPQ